ncbi:MAG: hypothetical protein ACE5KM_19670 [Planctomycetaceae bacterium]
MSVIGPGNLAAINLAGSAAGAQRTSAEADQAHASSAQRDAAANLKSMTSKALDGVDAADESAERDADGRMPFGGGQSDAETAGPADAAAGLVAGGVRQRAKDASGERGRLIDLDA